MVKALGRLPNAPLIYVLAQIVFTRIPNMESFWEKFHELVFSDYPDSAVNTIKEVQLGSSTDSLITNIVRWNMVNRENSTGIILGSDVITFHSSTYVDSTDFLEKLENIVSNFEQVAPDNIEVTRLGLRYIDLLLPENDISVDQQVEDKLGSISLDDAGSHFQNLEEVTRYKTSIGGELIFRHRQSNEKNILPADLFPNNLKPAPRLGIEVDEGSIIGLLDYDHFIQIKNEFNPKEILDTFRDLHKTCSNSFELTTTPAARDLWKKEKV